MREGSALRVTPQCYDEKKAEYKSMAYNNALGVDYDSSKDNYGVDFLGLKQRLWILS